MSETAKLGDLVTLQRGTTYKSGFVGQPGPVLLGLGTIARHGGFRGDSLRTYGGASPEELLVQPGQLYVSLKDVTQTADLLGAAAMVPSTGLTGRLTQDTVRLDLRADREFLDLNYLYWVLRTPQYRKYCASHATGTTTMGLPRESFLDFDVPLPNAARAATIHALSALDDKIAANSRTATVATSLAGNLYSDSVGSLPHIPVSECMTPISGGTPARSTPQLWGGPYPWASVKDVTNAKDGALLTTAETINEAGLAHSRNTLLPPGSVLLTARGTVGEVARIVCAASFNQSCYGFTPGPLPPGVLYFALARAAQRARAIAHGSVFSTITTRSFDELVVPDPRMVPEALEESLSPLLDAATQALRESERLAATRDALLPLLMSGAVAVKDAEAVL